MATQAEEQKVGRQRGGEAGRGGAEGRKAKARAARGRRAARQGQGQGPSAALTALRVGPEGGSTATEKRRQTMLFRQRFLDSVGFSKYT